MNSKRRGGWWCWPICDDKSDHRKIIIFARQHVLHAAMLSLSLRVLYLTADGRLKVEGFVPSSILLLREDHSRTSTFLRLQ
jgi:hypothetical protein